MSLLDDKVAVVTGVSTGIGWSIANSFIEQGARVVGVARREWSPLTAATCGDAFTFVQGDISAPETIERVIEVVTTRFDARPDILVNNAAILSSSEPDDWEHVFRINVLSVARLSAQLVPLMRSRPYGRIINIGSVLSVFGGGNGPYVASKHAVLGLTRTQALEYGRLGITANCLCPGAVDTEMFRGGDPDGSFRRRVEGKCPLGRMAHPNEIASAALFLASPLSSYVSGHALMVDGGLSAGIW